MSALLKLPEVKCLNDIQFHEFKEKVKVAYFKAAELVPVFDYDNATLSQDQLSELGQYLGMAFHNMPYCLKIDMLRSSLSEAFGRNPMNLS